MEMPVSKQTSGQIIPRSHWTEIKPKEIHAPLTLPLKGVIVHHTGVLDHRCQRSGETSYKSSSG